MLLKVSIKHCHRRLSMRPKFVSLISSFMNQFLSTEARPLRVFDSLRDGAATYAHIQRLRQILRRRWSRSLRRSPPGRPYHLPRPTRHNRATQSNPVRPPFIIDQSPPLHSKCRSEGNLINELDNANPTALLVSAIEKSALAGNAAKDDEFYLGVLRDGELWQLHHIMAGGPSRGTMALDTETAPGEGTSVQVCRAIFSLDLISTHAYSSSTVQ
jgi:hypothetical protein